MKHAVKHIHFVGNAGRGADRVRHFSGFAADPDEGALR
jgi:hypothetical protein